MVFTIEEMRPVRDGMTISRNSRLGGITQVTYFSMGKDTSISQESYDRMTMYIGAYGCGQFVIGKDQHTVSLHPDEAIIIPPKTLCGMKTSAPEGLVYTELILEKENTMNANIKTNEVFANMYVVSNSTMKYVLMAFDEGTGLTPHRAPSNAIVFALEGKATIGYEGKDYELREGECFRFEKNGLHSVTANGKFKMALLLVLE